MIRRHEHQFETTYSKGPRWVPSTVGATEPIKTPESCMISQRASREIQLVLPAEDSARAIHRESQMTKLGIHHHSGPLLLVLKEHFTLAQGRLAFTHKSCTLPPLLPLCCHTHRSQTLAQGHHAPHLLALSLLSVELSLQTASPRQLSETLTGLTHPPRGLPCGVHQVPQGLSNAYAFPSCSILHMWGAPSPTLPLTPLCIL